MAIKHVDLDDCYIPKTSTEDIIVSVKIGDGQSGSYSIFLGKELLTANEPATLGKSSNLKNKKTTVSAVVVDKLKETNWTSVTITITEGDQATEFGPYKVQAENHLDTVTYTLKLIHQ